MSNYRSRKLLDLAHRVTVCQFQLPGCRIVAQDGCEPVHADGLRYGKGTGIKAHDFYHAAGCHHCHEAYANLPKSEKQEVFDRAQQMTIALYFINGWIDVK